MFRRRRPRARRANRAPRRTQRQRRLGVEPLEDRRLLAIVSVSNTLDVSNAPDLSSIANLIANDGGDGISLREAITAANNTATDDEIRFDGLAAGVQTITITSALPNITDTVTIDGYVNRAGAVQNTLAAGQALDSVLEIVITDGAAVSDGLRITGAGANGSIIRGLVINGFNDDGIQIENSDSNQIQGNYIGVNQAGNADAGNSFGVFVSGTSTGNVIGGTTAASRNLISGNDTIGVFLNAAVGTTNSVQGNLIGTNRAGAAAIANGTGIDVSNAGATIGGTAAQARNVISGNITTGVSLNGASGAIVHGNIIGLNVAGAALGNGTHGILLSNGATLSQIGGGTAETRNIISGNAANGVEFNSSGGNFLLGNFIGTSIDGTAARPNTVGVFITNTASSNSIGSSSAGNGNVISGNSNDGIRISGAGTTSNSIRGNFIGTNAAGDAALGNGDDGVDIVGAGGNRVGDGTSPGRNVISGNSDEGVEISGAIAINNTVQGNFIGTAADGTTDIGNGADGVQIFGGATNNLIGGPNLGEGNTIAFNSDGVVVEDNASVGNRIQRNSIFSNDELGIDLADNGVTPNDAGDGDPGPNLFQNFPQFIGDATLLGNSLAVRYRVNSAPANSAYPLDIEFFIADSNNQEGRAFLGADQYALADAQQEKLATIPLPVVLSNTRFVATATDANGNTSEFSAPFEIVFPTILGSEPTLILPNQTIGQDDVDFYQYIAHSTGKLVVRIDFLHALGDLALEVRSDDGTLLASSDTSSIDQNFEQVIIPVVGQERYFISVIAVDFDVEQTQRYALEVENFPAPVPAQPDLAVSSDTGMMNDDNITASVTPFFRIQADLTNFASMGIPLLNAAVIDSNNDGLVDANSTAGAGVFVTVRSLDTGTEFNGFATRVGTSTNLWQFNVSTPLPDGEYFVSAAVQIVDGAVPRATGRGQLSDPLTFIVDTAVPNVTHATIDLLDYADSGMFDTDNVTNKMQPAFGGLGPSNTKVHVFAQKTNAAGLPIGTPLLIGSGVVGSENSDGNPENFLGLWEVTVEPLVDGKYNVFARFESLSGAISGPVGIGATKTNNTIVPIPSTGQVETTVTFALADFPTVGNPPMTTVPIIYALPTVNITHTFDGDLALSLIAPNGTTVALSTNNGGSGDNYTNTVFDQFSLLSITSGTPPFTGSFRPQQNLNTLNGLDAVGTWTLRVVDSAINDSGQINSFSLTLFTPLMVVIDTEAPNTPYLDVVASSDTGRNNQDNITKDSTPTVTMTSTDPNVNFAQLLFSDNLKFRIYDRYENTAEFLLYDSAADAVADAVNTAGDMFTSLTLLQATLPEQFFALVGTNNAVLNVGGTGVLADGVHNLKLEVEDRAGNFSHDFLLTLVVDTQSPPVAFGEYNITSEVDGLAASSDTGVTTVPDTYADRVTSDTTPTFWGRAEANTTVRLYLDRTGNGVIDLSSDPFLGQATAIPLDGNHAEHMGYWEITSILDLNQLVGLPKDGLRRILVTAEDVAGNPMPVVIGELPVIDQVASLYIFIDTQGPQITDVNLGPGIDYDLFDPKPSTDGPTPLIHSLFIDVQDLPFRVDLGGTQNDFLYDALVAGIAETIGNYELVGDFVGNVIIQNVIVHFESVVDGQPAFASIELVFSEPLPDDRYTLTVRDHLVDPAGNRLDGESGNPDPFEFPVFPTGDGVPGGNFVARFSVDSRPEIGVWAAGIIHIDTNGNYHFDPENVDFSNRDLIYTLGFSSDYIFAGNFVHGANGVADGFDKLAVYGRVGNQWRFLIDFDNDGVPDQEFLAPAINGIPVAGNFDGNAANGDEIGIFTGSAWFFDTNHDFVVDDGFATDYAGFPVAGDFDGDGDDDVATYIASLTGGNQFHIDLNSAGLGAAININGSADHTFRVGLPGLGTFGFAGVRERPVAADMNGDGADDLGLWVPDGTTILPGDQGEWFFLLSDFERSEKGGGIFVTETVIDRIQGGGSVDFVPFSTTPFGRDLYARFGNSFALPIVGNFDPPASPKSSSAGHAPARSTSTPTAPPQSASASTTPIAATSNPATPIVAPAATSQVATTTAATAAAKVVVPAVAAASSTTKTAAKTATSAAPAKAVKKLVVPVVQPATTKTKKVVATVSTPPKTAKTTTKVATPVAVPKAKVTAKVAKASSTSVKKAAATVAPKPVVAAKAAAAAKVPAKKTSKNKVVATAAAVPATATYNATTITNSTLKATTLTPSVTVSATSLQPSPSSIVVAAFVPVAELPPVLESSKLIALTPFEPVTPVAPVYFAPAIFSLEVAVPGVVASNSGSVQVAMLNGTLEFNGSSSAGPGAVADHALWHPAVADAALTDLRLTLADITTDAAGVAADQQTAPTLALADTGHAAQADAALTVELAWSTVSFGDS